MKEFITKEGLAELDNYTYKPYGYTWLDTQMNYFWEWAVSLVPKSIAPNLITFIGWLFLISSYLNILRYDYTFKKDLPSWCFFFAVLCIFIYVTLDAIDGKQARRTGSSSPLGQLFDHGCDSFSLTFFVLGLCQAIKLEGAEVFLIFIAAQTAFFVSNWSQYHTGFLRTKVGQFGVTEAEMLVILIHLITGFMGQGFWAFKLKHIMPFVIKKSSYPLLWKLMSLKVSTILVYLFGYGIIGLNIYVIINTVLSSRSKKETLLQFTGLFMLILMECLWSRMKIYEKFSGLILVNFGIIMSLLICKLIICSVTKMKFQHIHWQLTPLVIASLILWMLRSFKTDRSYLIYVFNVSIACNVIIILVFLFGSIKQISQHLGIYCFSLEKRQKKLA